MPEFNAATKGDQVVDTAAWGNTINNDFDNLNDCHYIGGAVDCQGTAIVPEYEVGGTYLISPTLNNFMMAPDTDLSCAPFFTPGQGIRMRQAIVGFYSNYFTSMRNTVESLYEPFVQNIIAGNTIVSVEDQPDNGGAYVCRNQLIRLRFQPGFICEFSDVVNGPITQTVNQQFNYDNSINHAIGVKIPILGNDIIKVGIVETLLCCACGFEPYISGSVISTEILGSMNLTIKELNEIQVKDPKLYDNLMEKYYYILKKQTNSGAKTEQVFYKN